MWRSTDLGATWTQSGVGLTYEDGVAADPEVTPAITRIWNVTAVGEAIYAGVEPAGLFRSDDGGVTWDHIKGVREHPSRPDWQPGAGGLILHSIVSHPTDPTQMWVGISAVGIFHTADGGTTWEARNKGVRADHLPDPYPETGTCVHKLALHAGRPDILYQQNHSGAYRSDDGGRSWIDINAGLPSHFGFPIAIHPAEPRTIWTIPLNGDDKGRYMPDGQAAVWMSQDEGAHWSPQTRGLPEKDAYIGVLREAMAVDRHDPAGVYFGTSTGQLYASRDGGHEWHLLLDHLPGISSVETVQLDS